MFSSGKGITILFLEGFIVSFPKRTVDLIKYCEKLLLKKKNDLYPFSSL